MNRIFLSVVAIAAVTGNVFAQQTTPMPEMDKKGSGMDMQILKPIPNDARSTSGYKAAMIKMMMDMPKFTGDPDIDFMKQMRPHHQAAVDMAKVVLSTGKDAETKALAAAIITAQQTEIATIDAWLKKNGAE